MGVSAEGHGFLKAVALSLEWWDGRVEGGFDHGDQDVNIFRDDAHDVLDVNGCGLSRSNTWSGVGVVAVRHDVRYRTLLL